MHLPCKKSPTTNPQILKTLRIGIDANKVFAKGRKVESYKPKITILRTFANTLLKKNKLLYW